MQSTDSMKLIKVPTQFFTNTKITIINFIQKSKKCRIAKTNIYNKGIPSCITVPDFKLCYRANVIKTEWYWHKNRQVGQWNQIDINLYTYGHLIFDKPKSYNRRKKAPSINGVSLTGCWHEDCSQETFLTLGV